VKSYIVGVSWQEYTPYVIRLENDIKSALKESGMSVKFLFMDGDSNPEKQISQVESFVASKVDLIILNPISYEKCSPAVDIAYQGKIPIMTLITRVKNQEKCVTHIGSDHQMSATLQCRIMQEDNNKGKIAVLEGAIGIEAQMERSRGYDNFLKENKTYTVVANQAAYWDIEEAYMITENWLYEKLDFDIILSQNDSMALGAAQAVKEYKLQDKIKIYGIDGDMNAIKEVKNGNLAGTILMDSSAQAKYVMLCIDKLTKRQKLTSEYLTQFIVITKDNAAEYLLEN
jgi:inositol transport system substrate-binding protein